MNGIKRILIITLTLVIALSATMSYALTNSDDTCTELSQMFIDQIDTIFQGLGYVKNSNGDDVTKDFLRANEYAHKIGDYSGIVSYLHANNIKELYSCTQYVRKEYDENGTKTILVFYYDEIQSQLVTQVGTPYNGKSWYLVVNASGSCRYQDSYGGYISSFPAPTISPSFSDLGAAFTGNITSLQTSTPIIYSSPVHATFSVNITHTVSCPIPGFSYLTGTLGPFTNQFSFDITPP